MNRQLLIVSNRLPVTAEKTNGHYTLRPSSGGLVTALDSVLRKQSGVWIGWPGTEHDSDLDQVIRDASETHPYRLQPVFMSQQEIADFYLGFCNEIIWPLFHDLQSRCNYDPKYWHAYCQVNERFAEATAEYARPDDFIWIHDYHFTLVAQHLRSLVPACGIGFFQHIPFPPADIFAKLPWRSEILDGMLKHDVIGFQTERDRRNFLGCIESLVPAADIVNNHGQTHIHYLDRCSRVDVFPISIDFREFAGTAATAEVAHRALQIRQEHCGRTIVLGVDRLDYTKGIVERLLAFRHLLRQSPQTRQRMTFVQLVVPSRAEIPKYLELKHEVERLVSEINGEFSEAGWVPVHYLYRSLSREELIACYRAAHIALITPLKDGMNLVAKEYCACHVDNDGVLILSEFAGAASQLGNDALLVNPNDQQSVATSLLRAQTMPLDEKRSRMRSIRMVLRENDVYRWSNSFISAGRQMQREGCKEWFESSSMAVGMD